MSSKMLPRAKALKFPKFKPPKPPKPKSSAAKYLAILLVPYMQLQACEQVKITGY